MKWKVLTIIHIPGISVNNLTTTNDAGGTMVVSLKMTSNKSEVVPFFLFYKPFGSFPESLLTVEVDSQFDRSNSEGFRGLVNQSQRLQDAYPSHAIRVPVGLDQVSSLKTLSTSKAWLEGFVVYQMIRMTGRRIQVH